MNNQKEQEDCDKINRWFQKKYNVVPYDISVFYDPKSKTFGGGKIIICGNKYS